MSAACAQPTPWFLWPFAKLASVLGSILLFFLRLVGGIVGLLLMILGLGLCLTLLGLPIGLPLVVLGTFLLVRSFF